MLERAPRRAVGDAEPVGRGRVEAAGPLVLDEGVADRRDAVVEREGAQLVAVAAQAVAGLQLDELHRVGEAPVDRAQRRHRPLQAGRAVDRQRQVAAAQGERLEQARQAENVVGVEVREEDVGELWQADLRAQELPLCALGTVDEQPLAPAPHEQRRRGTLRRRGRGGRSQQDEVEIHGAMIAERRRRAAGCPPRQSTGMTSAWPGVSVALASWLRSWIRQMPLRTSPW